MQPQPQQQQPQQLGPVVNPMMRDPRAENNMLRHQLNLMAQQLHAVKQKDAAGADDGKKVPELLSAGLVAFFGIVLVLLFRTCKKHNLALLGK